MSITTKTGDKGKTSLLWGGRVSKDSIRIELCGMLDGLCSNLGVPKALIKDKKEKDLLRAIQRDLFVILIIILKSIHVNLALVRPVPMIMIVHMI